MLFFHTNNRMETIMEIESNIPVNYKKGNYRDGVFASLYALMKTMQPGDSVVIDEALLADAPTKLHRQRRKSAAIHHYKMRNPGTKWATSATGNTYRVWRTE
jgi:putative ubiquitin-RnfH superfamily antitoxin RatB of RatAB toxin-antitoxin module